MNSRLVASCSFALLLQACLSAGAVEAAQSAELAGAKIEFVDYQGPATFSVQSPEKHKLLIDVDPRTERRPLLLRVELAHTGPNTWPFLDVEVLDSDGRAISVRRAGIQWHTLLLTLPAARDTFVVHAVKLPAGRPKPFSSNQRHVTDPATGLSAAITDWHGGRRAAFSIRFDDSHPTHLSAAVPTLNEYGFRGTFMVNPGGHPPNSRRRSAFHAHRGKWETVAQSGNHEFANHTLHHQGARNDQEMEYQVGEASKIIWRLFPDNSKLLALNLGGGTYWETTRTLRYYLDKYHLFDVSSGSLGMDDGYGNRVAAFRQHLQRHIDRAGWCKMHYHGIGPGHGAAEANFRAALDVAKEHQSELWIAGMADIHKYQTERHRAALAITSQGPHRAAVTLSCRTDPKLYDQDLTIEISLPKAWTPNQVIVTPIDSDRVAPSISNSGNTAIRCNLPPITATYIVEKTQ
jgi:polysaccharide deacetylase